MSNSEGEVRVRELVTGVDRIGLLLPITRQAELLGIARRSVYYQPVPVSEKELLIKNKIDEIYTACPFYGVRKITYEIRKELEEDINHKRIQVYMREMGLQAIHRTPNLSGNGTQDKRYPYLLRNVRASHPNHIWGTDITYIRMRQGFVYLVAFLDWFSRYVLSWQVSTTLENAFVIAAAQEALAKHGNPEIENSDQGSHFTSSQYIALWDQGKTKISMDGRGRCMDNIFTERLWRTIKYEEIYLKSYESVKEAVGQIGNYIEFYNTKRPHQSLGYCTPADIYFKERNGS